METQNIKIDFNETMLAQNKPAQYREGFYKGIVTKVEQGTAKGSKNLYLSLTLAAVDESDTPCETEIRHFVTLPIPNPNEPGHKPYKDNEARSGMFKRAREMIRTFEGPDFLPKFPIWDKETKVQYYPGTKDIMPPAEAKAMSKEVDTKTVQQLLTYWNSTEDSPLVGRTVFFAVKRKDDGWANTRYIRSDAGDETVSYSDFTE